MKATLSLVIMAREPIPTWYFVLVAVRRDDRFLLVHERQHGQMWYLPAGRVEEGEELLQAAHRETLEESGIPITINGVIRIEHSLSSFGARLRVILAASPADDTPLKSEPDEHTLGALWVTMNDLDDLPLRSHEVRHIFRYLDDGGVVYPLTLLTGEGAPFV
jgi:8-oxo-dGTP pyrophosphatase MutT (NUDIX family)